MKKLGALIHQLSYAGPEDEETGHSEDLATFVLVGFLAAVTLIALL